MLDTSSLITEDGAPVDNIYSEKQMRLLTEPLYNTWGGPPPDELGAPRSFVAFADVGVFATLRDPPIVPDVLVSVDVSLPEEFRMSEHRSYFVWEFGKVPDVVIEVVSNREGEELDDKKRRYAKLRVPHYVVWDPDTILGERRLHAFQLHGHIYRRSDACFVDALGLGLAVWRGRYENVSYDWLRWVDAKGVPLPTGAEATGVERLRVEEADAKAKEADAKAERLAARLRALGVDPDGEA